MRKRIQNVQKSGFPPARHSGGRGQLWPWRVSPRQRQWHSWADQPMGGALGTESLVFTVDLVTSTVRHPLGSGQLVIFLQGTCVSPLLCTVDYSPTLFRMFLEYYSSSQSGLSDFDPGSPRVGRA